MREEMVIILTEAEDQSCVINGRIKIGSYRNANAYCGKTDGGILLTLIRQNRLQIILGSKIRSNNFIGEGFRLVGNIALRHMETRHQATDGNENGLPVDAGAQASVAGHCDTWQLAETPTQNTQQNADLIAGISRDSSS